MKNVNLNVGMYVFVLGNDRSVCEAIVVDNSRWGDGFLTIETQDGRRQIADSDRCFRSAESAHAAARSSNICHGLISRC